MNKYEEFKNHCEDFFKVGSFESIEKLNSEIKNLSQVDFQSWQSAMLMKYDEKYNIIRNIIKEMRLKEDFKIHSQEVDWNKDPIRKEDNQIIVKNYQEIYNSVFENEITKFQIYMDKIKQLKDYLDYQQQEKRLEVNVDGKFFKAEQVIDVLWCGWECDNSAWLVNDNGVKKVVSSNHGSNYFADKNFLEEKIKEYEKSIEETKKMLHSLS